MGYPAWVNAIIIVFGINLLALSVFLTFRMCYSKRKFPELPDSEISYPFPGDSGLSMDSVPPPDGSAFMDIPPPTGCYDSIFPRSSQPRNDVERRVERQDMSTVDERIESSSTVEREYRKRAYGGKENGVGSYLNKVLRVLFMVSGLLTIVLSVVLDNSYNDEPVRFIPFGVLAPFTIFFGFLASGWFPKVPLRLIAFLKRHGFLRNVKPCSPWHDNVVTNFSGTICTLEPMEKTEGTLCFPKVLQTFLYDDLDCPLGIAVAQSALEPESSDFQGVSVLYPHSEGLSIQDSGDTAGTSHGDGPMTKGEAPSLVEETAVGKSPPMFHVADQGRILTLWGPTIRGFPLEVQALKNKSLGDSFDVFCTFRNTKSRRMFLNIRRLHNLAQNMLQWVENPYPIVVDESNDILHCMPIQDILWSFTKSLYTLKPLPVEQRFLGCLTWEGVKQYFLVAFLVATSMSGLIPLISDARSLYFLFLAVPIVAYIFQLVTGRLITYYFRSLFCPIFIRLRGFNELYRCRSFFTWCNEFRKQKVVNPAYFFIEQEYANRILDDGESCFNIYGPVRIPPNSSPEESSPITFTCRGRPMGDIQRGARLHEYRLVVRFDSVQDGVYMDVTLLFYDGDDLLDSRYFYGSKKVTVERLNLVETLFSYYSDPGFGGYVETIGPCFRSYLAHCPRFLDICKKIFNEDTIPTILIAARKPDSKLIIGDSSFL